MPTQWNSRIRLVDEVAVVLRDRVYDGTYAPGSRLLQEHLAAELGISRTPLREALRMLEQEGLLKVEPNRGVRVISGDVPTLLAAYEVRRVMDGLAARLVAETAGLSDHNRLLAAIDNQERALRPWSARAYTAGNMEFHRMLMEMTGNEFVVAQVPIMRLTAQVFTPVAVIVPDRASAAVEQHREILGAIVEHDGPRAEQLARDHIQVTIDAIRAQPADEAGSGD